MRAEALPAHHSQCLVAGSIEAKGSIGDSSGACFFGVGMALADGEGHGRIIMGNVIQR